MPLREADPKGFEDTFFQYSIGDAEWEWYDVEIVDDRGRYAFQYSIGDARLGAKLVGKKKTDNFQYSIGDAVNRHTGEVIRPLVDFQYSIGDASGEKFKYCFFFSLTSFNTPLEMLWVVVFGFCGFLSFCVGVCVGFLWGLVDYGCFGLVFVLARREVRCVSALPL